MTKKILNSLTDTIALSCGPDGPVTCEPRVEEQSAESERDKFCKRLNHKATAPFEFSIPHPRWGINGLQGAIRETEANNETIPTGLHLPVRGPVGMPSKTWSRTGQSFDCGTGRHF